jgi:hypothetical protein
MVHVERSRWLAMEAYALRMKLRQCDLRAISAAAQSASLRRTQLHCSPDGTVIEGAAVRAKNAFAFC